MMRLLSGVLLSAFLASGCAERPPELVHERVGPQSLAEGARRQRVRLSPDFLARIAEISVDTSAAEEPFVNPPVLQLNLFEGEAGSWLAQVEAVERLAPGTKVLRGTLRGVQGTFELLAHDGVLTAEVVTESGTYQLTPTETDEYLAQEVGAEPMERDLVEFALPPGESRPPDEDPVDGADSGSDLVEEDGGRLDLLVLYTSGTRRYWGSAAKVESAAYDTKLDLDRAFAATLPGEMPLKVRLVGMVEVPDDMPTSISGLGDDARAKRLRDARKADAVLVFHHRYSSAAGVARMYCGSARYHRPYAYGLIRAKRLWDYMTPSHEVGHLLGAAHNPEDASRCWRSDMRGHYFRAGPNRRLYGTMMSYDGYRLTRFSNPDVSYKGVPTGSAARNNAKAIRLSRRVVTNYHSVPESPSDGSGPAIEVLSPGDNAVWPLGRRLEIATRISDPEGVAAADLYWERTGNYLSCPGTNGRNWACTRQGDRYVWTVDVRSPGTRSYAVRARDARGHVSQTPSRRVRLVERPGDGPIVQVISPAEGGTLPARGQIEIRTRIADAEGVASAALFWTKTGNWLACPGPGGRDWSCVVESDTYRWRLKVGSPGRRSYAIRAIDGRGAETITETRSLVLR